MLNINKREKYLIIILITAIIVYVYIQYFLMPILSNISISKQNIEKSNSEISQIKVISYGNEELKKQLAKVKLNYQEALLELPTLEKNPEIAYNIKPMADNANVSIDSVSIGEGTPYIPQTSGNQKSNIATENSSLYSVAVNLSVSSSNYSNVMGFVNSLEADKRIQEITSFSIISDKSSNTNTTINKNISSVSATININYFYSLNNNEKPKYDFNKGTYGKDDIFN
jgi:hypothetical protein